MNPFAGLGPDAEFEGVEFAVATGDVRDGTVVLRQGAVPLVVQAVRATMLACLLERPPGLDEPTLIQEVVDLVLCYLVRQDSTDAGVLVALPSVGKTGARA